MIKRVVAITTRSFLRLEHDQLVIEQEGEESGRVPFEDIGALVLESRQAVVTQRVLSRCVELGVALLVCDQRYMPIGLLQSFHSNSLHAKYLRQQIRVTEATHRRLWGQVVTAKIGHQAIVLERLQRDARHLKALANRVKSGDKENLEAQAAREYWRLLFGEDFRRRADGQGVNAMLNYGYAIMRAIIARAVTMAGLHPALGIHHSNQYNAFALADDLIEPLRPLVDQHVYKLAEGQGDSAIELTNERKQQLLELTATDCVVGGRQLPLMVAAQSYCASVRKALFKEEKAIEFPGI